MIDQLIEFVRDHVPDLWPVVGVAFVLYLLWVLLGDSK